MKKAIHCMEYAFTPFSRSFNQYPLYYESKIIIIFTVRNEKCTRTQCFIYDLITIRILFRLLRTRTHIRFTYSNNCTVCMRAF